MRGAAAASLPSALLLIRALPTQGYYAACQVDYWYHGAPANECGVNQNPDPVTDFNNR